MIGDREERATDALAGNRCDVPGQWDRPARQRIKAGEGLLSASNLLSLPTSRESLLSTACVFLTFSVSDSFISCPFNRPQVRPSSHRLSSRLFYRNPFSNHVLLSFCRPRFLLHSLPRWPGCRRPHAHGGTPTLLPVSRLLTHRPSRLLSRGFSNVKLPTFSPPPSLMVVPSSPINARPPTSSPPLSLMAVPSFLTSDRLLTFSLPPSLTAALSSPTNAPRRSLPRWPSGPSTVSLSCIKRLKVGAMPFELESHRLTKR